MKKLLFFGLLLGVASQLQALLVTVLNNGTKPIRVSMSCTACKDDHVTVPPKVRAPFFLGLCACDALLEYPDGSSAWVINLNEGRKSIVVREDRNVVDKNNNGQYHWGWE